MSAKKDGARTAQKNKFSLLKPFAQLRITSTSLEVSRERVALSPVSPRLPANDLTRPPTNAFARSRGARRQSRWLGLLFVAIPTLVSVLYCYMLAAPLYLSSARFAIRGQAEAGAGSVLGKIMQGSGASGIAGLTDGFAVRDFLLSADALDQLNKKAGFVGRMKQPHGDLLLRLKEDQRRESVLDFYHRVVKVRFNMTEGIVSVDAYAYTPADALAIASQLTDMAGEFSNEINRRATEDTLRVAKEDVRSSEERMTSARLALTNWRKDNSNLDLEANAKMIQTIVGQLELQLSEAKSEQTQLINSGLVNSPRKKVVEDRIKTLGQQIARENGRLTSTQDASVVNLLTDYQKLTLDQEFANKSYELALQALHNAQTVVSLRQKFVAVIVSPNLPEEEAWPVPSQIIPITIIASIFMYLVGSLGFSVLRDNQGT